MPVGSEVSVTATPPASPKGGWIGYRAALKTPRGRAAFWHCVKSILLYVLVFLPVANPFEIAFATWFLMIFTRLLCVSIFYWSYRWAGPGRYRDLLQRLVTPRNRGAYVSGGGSSTLLGNLVLLFVFFWPAPAFAIGVIRTMPPWLVASWLLWILKELLSGAIFMDFTQSVRDNFGYNLVWMWEMIFFFLLGFIMLWPVMAVAVLLRDQPAERLGYWGQWTAFACFMLALHAVQFTMRMDTSNVDWSGEPDTVPPLTKS